MAKLKSFDGALIIRRYCKNWIRTIFTLIGVYHHTEVQFRDGKLVPLDRYSHDLFHEEIYVRFNEDHGFTYKQQCTERSVVLPKKLGGYTLSMGRIIPYSFEIDEVFIQNSYRFPNLSNMIAIDIGAGIGDSAIAMLNAGAKKVFAYEPDRERFMVASKNIRQNKLESRIFLFNYAVSARGEHSFSSIITSIDNSILFLKMDCEGCEYEILGETGKEYFNRIAGIALEYHNSAKPLAIRLRNLGFKVTRFGKIIVAVKMKIY